MARNQPLAFAELLVGGVLLTAAISGHSPRDVISGTITPFISLGGDDDDSSSTSTGTDAGAADVASNYSAGTPTAKGVGRFDGKPVALWIVPILTYGRNHGWKGTVNSGYRTLAEQTAIYNSGVRPAAPPGHSNHEGGDFPRGAVDVTDAAQLSEILLKSPYHSLLVWAGSKDPVHFSHPHNGSY